LLPVATQGGAVGRLQWNVLNTADLPVGNLPAHPQAALDARKAVELARKFSV
jgi:hypothetical protein